MKRIFHIADTHIGYSAYRKIDESTGLNQREVDTCDVFKQFVDYTLKDRPDAVLHAGDLFDSVRPTNRAISFALSQILRLSDAGIPFVVISGNHETPRLKETGSVFSLFEHIPGVHVIYENGYELVEIDDLKVHVVPHCDDIERENKKLSVRDGFNIAMLHASVLGTGLPAFMMGEFNEQSITIDGLTDFDYIALGHYHKCTQVRADAYYAGSTERFSISEADSVKGFLEVRLGTEDEKAVIFHALRTRAMQDLEPIQCSCLDEHEIKKAIRHRIQECNPRDKIVRLKVQDIPLHVYHSLDFDELKRLTRSAVHFELKYEFRTGDVLLSAERPAFHSLHDEFDHFVGKYTLAADINKDKLRAMGSTYMREWAGYED